MGISDLLMAVPLIVALSLVYAATRHEQIGPILVHALRFGAWIAGFLLVILLILVLLSWQV